MHSMHNLPNTPSCEQVVRQVNLLQRRPVYAALVCYSLGTFVTNLILEQLNYPQLGTSDACFPDGFQPCCCQSIGGKVNLFKTVAVPAHLNALQLCVMQVRIRDVKPD